MTKQTVILGTAPTGGAGDTVRQAFTKVNANADELYAASDAAATKLATIATGATANATDAQLRGRATHTGTQAISTVSGLQVALDGKQPSNANLTAFSGLTGTADRLPYFTGAGALSLTTLTGLARDLLDDTTKSGMQSTLGLVKQTSATDTTANALMTVGAFGLGTDSQATNIDPNTVRYGSILGPVSQPNAPSTECVIWSGGRSAGTRSAQLAIDHGSPANAWIRSYNSGRVGAEWAPWTELWASASANAITVDTGSMGYGTGSGGTVTQTTSKSTTVTLNKPSGRVTTTADSLAGGASVVFLLNNSKIAAVDVVLASIASAPGASLYEVSAWGVTAGLCYIRVKNLDAAAQAHAVAINFVVIKGAIA